MTSESGPRIRYATEADVPTILQLIRELAIYEKEESAVQATEHSLLATLSFPSPDLDAASATTTSHTAFTPGYAKTLLVFPSADPSAPCAGMALYFHNYSTWRAAPGIFLEDLFVRPEHRGRGYGKALLRELAKITVAVGGKRLEWSVLKWNEPSIRFYEDSIGATRMEDWVGMRVDNEVLDRMAS